MELAPARLVPSPELLHKRPFGHEQRLLTRPKLPRKTSRLVRFRERYRACSNGIYLAVSSLPKNYPRTTTRGQRRSQLYRPP